MKRCKTCEQEKDASEFYKEPRVKDGLTATCKTCSKTAGAKWQAEHRDQYNETQRRWRERHPETALQKGRDWRANNRKRSNAFSRKWARANPEKTRARQKRWVAENRARVALYAAERRAREAGASGSSSPEQLQARIDYYGGKCWVCRGPFDAVDHVISLNKGGSNWPANLRPACTSCNASKGDEHPIEFMERRAEDRLS